MTLGQLKLEGLNQLSLKEGQVLGLELPLRVTAAAAQSTACESGRLEAASPTKRCLRAGPRWALQSSQALSYTLFVR